MRLSLPLPPPPQLELGPHDPTEAIQRGYPTSMLVKVIALMTVAVVIGALAGRLVAREEDPSPKPTPPAPVAAPSVEPISVPVPPQIDLVTVRFESSPAGAAVQLVENNRTIYVGTTPVTASIDAARVYDVAFTLAGQAPKLERLAPAATRQLSVSFEAPRTEPASRTERRAKPRKLRRRAT